MDRQSALIGSAAQLRSWRLGGGGDLGQISPAPTCQDPSRLPKYSHADRTSFSEPSHVKKCLEFLHLVAGGETAGIPYAAFLSNKLSKPMIYIRKKPKGFGINKQIEGEFQKNHNAILIEDLATDGGSKIIFINALREAGLIVKDIFVIFYYDIFDFESSELSQMNIKIHSLCTWKDIINYIETEKIYNESEISNLKEFLSNPKTWREKYG